MKTSILICICAAFSLGTAATRAADVEQQGKSSGPSTDTNTPKSIACAQERGEALGQCTYRIKRNDKGKVTITAVFANGFKRKLFFKDGKFLKASVTMSGVGTNTDWSLKDGTHMIRVDGQRYEVPDSLIAADQ